MDNNRTFGIEIEAFNCDRAHLASVLRDNGIEARTETWNHSTRPYWKVTTDSTIRGFAPFELVSPILKGQDGLLQVKKVCEILNSLNVKVNKSCGLHVHHDAGDFRTNNFENLFWLYKKAETAIDSLVSRSRRNGNTFCKTLRQKSFGRMRYDRYHKVNLTAYEDHGTVEFRQHNGTIDCNKITNWIQLTQLMVNDAVTKTRVSRTATITWDKLKERLGIISSSVSSAPNVSTRGIGGYVMSNLIAGTFDGMSNSRIADAVKDFFPNANTTAKSVAWYKHKLRRETVVTSTTSNPHPLGIFFDRRREVLA